MVRDFETSKPTSKWYTSSSKITPPNSSETVSNTWGPSIQTYVPTGGGGVILLKHHRDLRKPRCNMHSLNPVRCLAPAIPLRCPFLRMVFQCQTPSRSSRGRGYPLTQPTGKPPQSSWDWPLLTMTAYLPVGICKHELIQSPGEKTETSLGIRWTRRRQNWLRARSTKTTMLERKDKLSWLCEAIILLWEIGDNIPVFQAFSLSQSCRVYVKLTEAWSDWESVSLDVDLGRSIDVFLFLFDLLLLLLLVMLGLMRARQTLLPLSSGSLLSFLAENRDEVWILNCTSLLFPHKRITWWWGAG